MVVDDHRMFAEALELLLGDEEDIEIAGITRTGEEALASLEQATSDVVLMDLDLPGMDGLEATRRVREQSPHTQVVVITALQDPSEMAAAVSAGACGFVPKTHAADELLGVIRRAAAGEIALPPMTATTVLRKLQTAQPPRSNAGLLFDQLTDREIEVLQAVAEGATTRELGSSFGISQQTVQTHVKNILAKLGVHSKLEAVTFALRQGIVHIPNGAGTGRPAFV